MRTRRLVAAVLAILLTTNPAYAFECWYTNDTSIWSLPIDMIMWYIYWTIPQLWNQMPYFNTVEEALMWLVSNYCSFAG